MEAVLEFFGRDFAVDAALADSPWKEQALIWHRGSPIGSLGGQKDSGFSLWVAGDKGAALEEQIAEALEVLEEDSREIRRIRELPDVETARLRFGELWPPNIVARSPRLPSKLLLACGQLDLDIVLCQYLCSDEPVKSLK
jgi:hypothetical protein